MAHQKNDDFQKKIVVSFCSLLFSHLTFLSNRRFWRNERKTVNFYIQNKKEGRKNH